MYLLIILILEFLSKNLKEATFQQIYVCTYVITYYTRSELLLANRCFIFLQFVPRTCRPRVAAAIKTFIQLLMEHF